MTTWDIDDYRVEYEPEDHWELRKAFMVKHKNDFEEDELVKYSACGYHKG
jgi:hypothetical protein